MANKKEILDKIMNWPNHKLSYKTMFKRILLFMIIWTFLFAFLFLFLQEKRFFIILIYIISILLCSIPLIYNYINWKRGN